MLRGYKVSSDTTNMDNSLQNISTDLETIRLMLHGIRSILILTILYVSVLYGMLFNWIFTST